MKGEVNISKLQIKKRAVDKKSFFGLFTPLLAVFLAMICGAGIIAMAGANPIYAYQWLLYGSFGNINSIAETLVKTTPLLIAGLGLAISFRASMTSIGAPGQIIMGGAFCYFGRAIYCRLAGFSYDSGCYSGRLCWRGNLGSDSRHSKSKTRCF